MSSFTASGGIPEYYQSPGGHYGTNQSESMQVAENSSEVMGNIRKKHCIVKRNIQNQHGFFFVLHIKLLYLNDMIGNFTCIRKLHILFKI